MLVKQLIGAHATITPPPSQSSVDLHILSSCLAFQLILLLFNRLLNIPRSSSASAKFSYPQAPSQGSLEAHIPLFHLLKSFNRAQSRYFFRSASSYPDASSQKLLQRSFASSSLLYLHHCNPKKSQLYELPYMYLMNDQFFYL